MRIGDKVIVTFSNFTRFHNRVGVIQTIYRLDNCTYPAFFPYRVVLDDNTIVWCKAIPYSSLMMELV